jgi:beta-ketoacyl synthase-like protein
VALFHGLRGPNITLSSKNFAGESALLQAASLLRHGQADLAVVIAGDTLTQTMYEWYETAGLLSPACSSADSLPEDCGFVPSEGVVALIMEPEGRHSVRSYAHLHAGRWATGGELRESIHQLLGNSVPRFVIGAGNGIPCSTSSAADSVSSIAGPAADIISAQPVASGLTDTGALLHLVLALSARPGSGQALMLSTTHNSGFAALLLDLH